MEDYDTEGDEQVMGFGDPYYSQKKLKSKDDNLSKRSYLVAKYWKDEIKGQISVLLKTKELSIIIPTMFAEVTDPEYDKKAIWMVYEDLQIQLPNSLSPEQCLISAIQLGFCNYQLIIALKRLEEQGINLKIFQSMLIVYEGRLYLTLKNYNFKQYDQYECFEAYKKIVKNLVPNLQQHLGSKSTYVQIIDYLVDIIKPNGVNLFEVPYLWLLEKIIQPLKSIRKNDYEGNSYIYELLVPDSLKYKQRNPHKTEIVIKSTKLPAEYEPDYQKKFNEINQNVNRELEIFESFGPDDHVLQCWGYIKIYNQTFIFMDKNYDLITYMDYIRQQNQFGYKLYVKLALEFAKSLLTLHKHQDVHRDLKEGNLFVSEQAYNFGRLFVGDFDRSKNITIDKTLSEFNEMTFGYNPPEVIYKEKHTQKSDIWQYGLILWKIACKEFFFSELQYAMYLDEEKIITQKGGVNSLQDPFRNVEQIILDEFAQENLDEKSQTKRDHVLPRMIAIILQCLKVDQAQRPTANEIYMELHDLYWTVIMGIKKRINTMHSLTSTSETESPHRIDSGSSQQKTATSKINQSPLNSPFQDKSPANRIRIISSKTIN